MAVTNFESAYGMLSDPLNCFHLETVERHLMLPPRQFGNVIQGIKEQLDSEINIYCDRLGGVVVSYSKLKLLGQLAKVVGSQPCLHVHVQADFIVFQPTVGSVVKGTINKVGRDHLGLLVHGVFNATVPRPKNDNSQTFSMGQPGIFEVVKIYQQNGLLSMRAMLRPDSFAIESYRGLKRKAAEIEETLSFNMSSGHSPFAKKSKHEECPESSTVDNSRLSDMTAHTSTAGQDDKAKKKKKKRDSKEIPDIHSSSSTMPQSADISDDVTQTGRAGKHKKKKKKSKDSQDSFPSHIAAPQFTSTPAVSSGRGASTSSVLDDTMAELKSDRQPKAAMSEMLSESVVAGSIASSASDTTVDSGIGHVSKEKAHKVKKAKNKSQTELEHHHKSKKSKKAKKKSLDV